jgi:Nif-specific regulatory protein
MQVDRSLDSPANKIRGIETSGNHREALEELEHLSRSLDPRAEPLKWADLLAVRGLVYLRLGRLREAIRDSEEAFAILRGTDQHQTVGIVLRTLGGALMGTGEIDRARQCLQDGVSTFRRIGDEQSALWCSNDLARSFLIQGEWRSALSHLEAGLAHADASSDDRRAHTFCVNIGTVHRMLGNWAGAEGYYLRGLAVLDKMQDGCRAEAFQLHRCRTWAVIAALRTLQRRWDEGRELLQQALEISRELGFEREEAIICEYWGDLEFAVGDYTRALEFFENARQIVERTAPRGDVANEVYRRLSETRLALGMPKEAETLARQALDISQALGDRAEEATSYRALAMALWKQNRMDEAAENFESALRCYAQIEERFEQAKTLLAAALFFMDHRDDGHYRPRHLLARAQEIFAELGSEHWVGRVELAQARLAFKGRDLDSALQIAVEAAARFDRLGEKEHVEIARALRTEIELALVASSQLVREEYALLEKLSEGEAREVELARLLELVVERAGADRGFVAFRPAAADGCRIAESHELSKDEASRLLGWLTRSMEGDEIAPRRPIISARVAADERFREIPGGVGRVSSLMVIPVGIDGTVDGFIYIDRLRESQAPAFGQRDLETFILFSGVVALKLVAMRDEELIRQNLLLRRQLEERSQFRNIITQNRKMIELLDTVLKVVDRSMPVLLEGETGTGKELVARAIHYNSKRRGDRFVVLNCAALPETLLESELFGHRKGAFTGAVEDKRGLLEVAHRGTLFLDEVSEMGPGTQAKLLRVLETGEIMALGATETRKVDVRLISASNKSLKSEVEIGRFREDLYYRLNTLCLVLPPLRQRREDIQLLAEHFLALYSQDLTKRFSPAAMRSLLDYPWPGNVRELRHEVERAAALSGDSGQIEPSDFSPSVQSYLHEPQRDTGEEGVGLTLVDAVNRLERDMIERSLIEHHGNKTRAALELGVSRQGLLKKLKRYGMI